MRCWQVEPCSAIDFRKRPQLSTLRWPFDFERVALHAFNVEIALDRERDNPLAPTLTDIAKWLMWP
jgi:hypothetical protein